MDGGPAQRRGCRVLLQIYSGGRAIPLNRLEAVANMSGMRRVMRMPGRWPTSNTSCMPMDGRRERILEPHRGGNDHRGRRCGKCCTVTTTT